jgi:dihydrofolate synthase/folylpolyglutamate synthase
MTYEQAIAFWYSRVNYEQRTPAAGDFKLDRMHALLRILEQPHERLRIVHIAGSKGKGSTAAMLASILRRAGYHTGLFTSPHLVRVEERIQVDGQPITGEALTELLAEVRTAVTGGGLEPTFFEIATAVGFLHFVRQNVDIAVVEVGLGGRLDSTNVCTPLATLITSISYDHTQLLGSRLASIAAEKAGIIKPGRPVVSGVTVPEAADVIRRVCRERRAPLLELGTDFHYCYDPGRVTADEFLPARVRVALTDRPLTTHHPPLTTYSSLGLLGEHQAANAAVAVVCIERLRAEGWRISDAAVADGLATVHWPARLELVGRRPLVVLDCAHNVASAVALVETLMASFPPSRRWLIFAGSGDKDLAGMFRVLAPHFAHAYLTEYKGSTRAARPEQLSELLRQTSDMPHTICRPAGEAWQAARASTGPDDLICVTGSVFLAGELQPLLVGPDLPN